MPRSRREDTVDSTELDDVVRWLRKLIDRSNLTQNDFANRIGVSTTYVNMLLQKKRKPSLPLLRRIADVFADVAGLQSNLPRAYNLPSKSLLQKTSSEPVSGNLTIDSLFGLLQQTSVPDRKLLVEHIYDRSLEPWGVLAESFCLCESVSDMDLISGDLIVHGTSGERKWGFVHSTGAETYIVSAGYHLKNVLRLDDAKWGASGFQHLEIAQYPLRTYFYAGNIQKVRLIFGTPPNLRTPLVNHPGYQFLKPADRDVVDQVITRFTGYAHGRTGYQPSQER